MSEGAAAKRESRAARVPEQGRRATVTFRCLPALQAKIQDAAAQSGRSSSEEIERRIEDSFAGAFSADVRTKGIFESVAQMISVVERGTGRKWWEDELTASMCGDVVRELINSLMPRVEQPANKLLELVESDKARLEREAKEALWQTTVRMNAIDRALAILSDDQKGAVGAKPVDSLSQSKKKSDTE